MNWKAAAQAIGNAVFRGIAVLAIITGIIILLLAILSVVVGSFSIIVDYQ